MKRRIILKIGAWTLGSVLGLVIVAVAILLTAGNTDSGRAMIESWTRKLTSDHVVLAGLSGSFPAHLSLARLELRDTRGVWLSADRITLDWSPLAWLTGRLQIDNLHAAVLDMERLPEVPPSPNPKPVTLPRIDAARVSVDVAKLGAPLAGRPATLTFESSMHLYAIDDMRFDVRAHRLDGSGDYVLKLSFDRSRMDADLDLHEPASGPLENIIGLPGLGALAAGVSLHGPRTAEHLDLRLQAGSLEGRANGNFNLRDLSADLDFSFASGPIELRPEFGWQRAKLQGRWHGSLKTPNADGRLEIERLALPGKILLAGATANVSAAAGEAKLDARLQGLRIPGPSPGLLEDSPLEVKASMRLDQDTRPVELSASHRLFALQVSAATAAGHRVANGELKVPALEALAGLIGEQIRGRASVKARAEQKGDEVRLDLDAGADLEPGKQAWAAAAGKRVDLSLSAAITPSSFDADRLKLSARAGILRASGSLARAADPDSADAAKAPGLRARWQIDAGDLKVLSPALAGNLQAAGDLKGPIDALSLAGKLRAALSVRGSPTGTLTAGLSMRGLPSAPSGTLVVDGGLDGAPLHLEVLAERARPSGLHARIGRAEWKSAVAEGEITMVQARGQSHGEIHLRIGDLADLDRLVGVPLAGGVDAQMLLRPDRGQTLAKLHATAAGLKVGGFAGNIEASAEGPTDALNFKLVVQAPDLGGKPLGAAASGLLSVPDQEISLISASAVYRGQTLSLLSPARVSFAQGVRLEEVKIGAQHAVLTASGQVSPALDLQADLHGLDPTLLNAFVPDLLASGEAEAHLRLHGNPSAPTGEASAAARNVLFRDDAALGLPPMNARLTAGLQGDHAEVDAQLDAGTASKVQVKGTLALAAGGPVDLKIHGALDAGMFNALLEARGQHASGDLGVDISVAGTLADPDIGGTLSLAKGTVRDYSRGIGLTDITATLVGTKGSLEIKTFTAAAAPGTVSITGRVGILQAGMPIDLGVKAVNAQPISSKLVTANLDADLTIKGKLRERIDIGGDVKLHRTLIGVPNGLPPNVAVLDVRRRGQAAAAAAAEKQLVIGLELRIESLQGILVQGRGLDAEVGGNLRLGGTTDSPTVSGGFELQRGTFSIGSSKLNFNQGGRVSFNGAGLKNRIDPTLDFTAQSTVGDVTATLQISGLADAPKFEFSSSPALAQDEIMARLLFGAPAAQLTGLQLAETGAALATLSGVGGDSGLNPLVKLQKSLGLDRLSVGAGTPNATGTENTGARIEAGRYISRRVFIAAKQSTTGTSQLEADVDITKHLKLQTRVGNGSAVSGTTPDNDPGSSIGLSYQIEY